ncbi:MAG: 2-amino-4-hydroxy-6-hydroxymethyldihydropteridine diphosphokinase [Proteobacteria bacterium]|nr:2-amino-4-hydroxy-6-hydroxymethyldihydropteridine diphosphokinase [Pseudomonadota bacterium]MDA0929271.1 2-amino-4-hydroxy-6-hydroxymethyldihydropteridine diphosphokinase [Pseudomonadota bacterium]
MPLLTLSIGSNVQPRENILLVIKILRRHFRQIRCSSVYESEAVGFDGANFLNLVLATETDESIEAISAYLKNLEDDTGRDRSAPKFSGRTMDIDILTYGDLCGSYGGVDLPRGEILEHAFVLQPLAELLPDVRHPVTGMNYREHWESFQLAEQKIWPIDFDWQED